MFLNAIFSPDRSPKEQVELYGCQRSLRTRSIPHIKALTSLLKLAHLIKVWDNRKDEKLDSRSNKQSGEQNGKEHRRSISCQENQ